MDDHPPHTTLLTYFPLYEGGDLPYNRILRIEKFIGRWGDEGIDVAFGSSKGSAKFIRDAANRTAIARTYQGDDMIRYTFWPSANMPVRLVPAQLTGI